MHVNIILPSVIKYATWSLPLGLQTRIMQVFLMSLMNDKYSSQLIHDFVSVVILQIPVFFST